MSSAFVKESEEQWLHDVSPTMPALLAYLTIENNNVRVYEKRQTIDKKTRREIYEMSNGFSYTKDNEGKWEIVW